VDVVQFQGAREEYLVSKSAGSVAVIDRSGRDGSDILVNAERIKFSDQMVALDVEGNAGQVYRLYQAAFNRTPDKVGLGFWISMVDNGLSLDAIAREFVASDEFKTLYGAAPSTEVLINAIYQNVLHRAPDKGGFDFWLDVMSNHGVTPSVLVTEFSESAENKAALATVIGNGFDYVPFG
jgi:serralysin